MDWCTLKPLKLSKINFIDFSKKKYYQEIYKKNQIILHHTVSGPGIYGDLKTWLANSARISTCIIIDRDGTPNQMFSSKYWAYHTGKGKNLDRHSIGIEFDNWGGLLLGDGTKHNFGTNKKPKIKITKPGIYYAVYGNKVYVPVVKYEEGFRGFKYYERYTEEQIKTVGELSLFWNNRYGIPLTYRENMWDVSQDAINGVSGIWTHVSLRSPKDKQDCHPQSNLIDMLKTLSEI